MPPLHSKLPRLRPASRRLVAALAFAIPLVAAPTGHAAVEVTGLEQSSQFSAADSSSFHGALAACPTGKQVLGPGGRVIGGGQVSFRSISLDGIIPGTAGVDAQGFENSPTIENWFAAASSVCADPVPQRQVVSSLSATGANFFHQAQVTCPPGLFVVGAAADISGGAGKIVLDDVTPNGTLKTVTATAYQTTFSGASPNWSVRAYAVCAPVLGLMRIVAQKTTSNLIDSATAVCPPGRRLLGGGADVTGGAGAAFLRGSSPDSAVREAWGASATESVGGGPSGPWTLTSYAICAPPA
jgi:hypothetical protein